MSVLCQLSSSFLHVKSLVQRWYAKLQRRVQHWSFRRRQRSHSRKVAQKNAAIQTRLKKKLHIQDVQASVYKYAHPTSKSATTFNRSE
ncbi:unnamed protein product [Ixodes persulcatus]